MEKGIGSRFRIKKNADMPQRLEEDENLFRVASPLGPECGCPLLRPLAEADLRLPGQAAMVLARTPGVGARAQRQQVGHLPLRLLGTP